MRKTKRCVRGGCLGHCGGEAPRATTGRSSGTTKTESRASRLRRAGLPPSVVARVIRES